MKAQSFLMVAMFFVGCGGGEAFIDEGDDALDVTEGPLLGANGQDAADRACNVVLRSLTRGGTKCTSTGCSVVWSGVMEVSDAAIAQGGVPWVMWKNQDASTWTQLKATANPDPATPGFKRFTVKLDKKTISPGLSATGLSRARIDVAPFVKLPNGARIFDKQRGQSDYQNYTLTEALGWQVADDATVCAAPAMPAQLDFTPGQVQQRGALIAGGKGVIRYTLDRITTCRGTHNGYPAWDIVAYVKFFPGGQLVSGSVKGNFTQGNSSNVVSVPYTFDVPADATRAEVWFNNFTGAGSSCTDWDSNGGANFGFTVESKAFRAPQWVGNSGSSTSRACSRSEGAPLSLTLDSYLQQRACVWVESDVYVPGLTDAATQKSYAVLAEAELVLDGKPFSTESLSFVQRVGNDYRFHYELPKSALYYVPTKWSRLEYTLRFSTDGRTWLRDVTRTVVRDATFCNTAWGDCSVP